MVVKQPDRFRRSHRVGGQVSEHLLRPPQAAVGEDNDRHRLVAHSLTTSSDAARRCCPSWIKIVTEISMRMQPTERNNFSRLAGSKDMSQSTEALKLGRTYRLDFNECSADRRDPGAVNGPLGLQFGQQTVLIDAGQPGM